MKGGRFFSVGAYRNFPAFLFSGGVAALVNLGSRWLLSFVLPFPAAIIIAYMLGMATAFPLFKFFVFHSTGPEGAVKREALWFTLVNVLALLQTLVVSLLLADWLFPATGFSFRPHDVAHCIGVAVPAFTSYWGHKYFTFRSGQ
jgi:putative flippase GtrA